MAIYLPAAAEEEQIALDELTPREIVAELAKLQQSDGSWVNSEKRFLEDDPVLVTGYGLIILSHCKPK